MASDSNKLQEVADFMEERGFASIEFHPDGSLKCLIKTPQYIFAGKNTVSTTASPAAIPTNPDFKWPDEKEPLAIPEKPEDTPWVLDPSFFDRRERVS